MEGSGAAATFEVAPCSHNCKMIWIVLCLALLSPALSLQWKWVQVGKANSSQLIEVMIAIKQNNLDALEKTLLDVSDPDNVGRYGKYLTQKQVDELVKPNEDAVRNVKKWLLDSGVEDRSIQMPSSDFMTAVVSVEILEKITKTEYFSFKHESVKDTFVVRSVHAPVIPPNVMSSIDFFFPGADLPKNSIIPKIILRDTNDDGVSPDFLREIYGISDADKFGTQSNNRQAVAQFLKQYYSADDLQQFASKFNSDSPFDTSSVQVVGPNDASNPGVEASLDIQYITAIGNNISTIFYSTDGQQPGNPENEPFLKWLQVIASTPDSDIPLVVSISYGDDESTVNLDYAKRVNVEFQKAGVRGISLLFASGDDGVGSVDDSSSGNCLKFSPSFPAASPWVTAVGGSTGRQESGDSISGGGFSNFWDRPKYQISAVGSYLSNYASDLPDSSLYNSSGAGFPDVAAQSENYNVFIGGELIDSVSGTSAATPTFAGVISLLNDIRLKNGKSPLGYLNPLLYKHPEIFNDITDGNNPNCNTNGFQAKQGWDPVTGLGTPNFPKMAALIHSLP